MEPASPRSRADANRIAFGAIRSILEAAAPLSLTVEGTAVAVSIARVAPEPWPAPHIPGLDEATDGPWPRAVQLDCRWEDGRAQLVMSAALGRGSRLTRHLAGIRIASATGGRSIVWVTLPLERVDREASFSLLQLPSDAFRRLVQLALVKLPFLAAESGAEGLFEGAPLFDIAAIDAPREAPRPGARLARLYPLPGGVRHYKATFDAILGWVASARPRTADPTLRLLEATGFVQRRGDHLEVSALGQAYLSDPDPERLFDRLHAVYLGLLEALVIVDHDGRADTATSQRLLEGLVGKRYKTAHQVHFRRNWLLSLGLCDRTEAGLAVTPLGRQVLGAHAAEVAEIRRRIADLQEEQLEEDLASVEGPQAPLGQGDEEESAPLAAEPRFDLTPAMVRPHTGGLELPDVLLERICAALSAGKHLLLVGPPGTGKTEIAMALGAAAARAGYAEGLFSATASADWTTFDTIGGYTLQKDGSLRFRPGVFLTAIERGQWLLIDELNRADVDRSFGELLTVLAGRSAVTPFTLEDGRLISIGPEARVTHRVPPSFRLIGTMNTWDKSSLFRLSYAVQRRFAVVHIGIPADPAYARLITDRAAAAGVDPPLDPALLAPLLRLFQSSGVLASRPIGPAVVLDMIRYLRRRAHGGDGLAEALAMYLLPQLEGLDPEPAARVWALLDEVLQGLASEEARAELQVLYGLLFPHVRLA